SRASSSPERARPRRTASAPAYPDAYAPSSAAFAPDCPARPRRGQSGAPPGPPGQIAGPLLATVREGLLEGIRFPQGALHGQLQHRTAPTGRGTPRGGVG